MPSEPTNRSTRSMRGAAKYPADRFGTSGIAYDGTGIRIVPRLGLSTSKYPSGCASTSPRARASTSPDASTTRSASTQGRVEPYLKVAAPAAFVDTTPPAKAPRNVGDGGKYSPFRGQPNPPMRSGVPRRQPGRGSVRRLESSVRRAVVTTSSPIGVAPPVSDDCAPSGRTCGVDRTRSATSASDRGNATAGE